MAEIDYARFKILIVDDVPLNVLLVQKMLSRFPFQFISCYGGQEAIDIITNDNPDLVLLDLMMPVVDGFQVLDYIRSKTELNDMRIIILSALNSDADIMRGFQAGANDFVTKPIIMERLLNAINKQLEELS